MSLLRKILKYGKDKELHNMISGILLVDINGLPSSDCTGALPCCRSPFTSSKDPIKLEMKAGKTKEGKDLVLYCTMKICAWYELGIVEGKEFGAIVFENAGPSIKAIKLQFIQFFSLDEFGKPMAFGSSTTNFKGNSWEEVPIERTKENTEIPILDTLVRNIWFANSLATCGNVEFREDYSGRNEKRERQEHKGLVWHRLVIKKNVRGGSGKPSYGETHEPVNRMHLMRGHFKTYTKENPLLGKHTGTWWWSPTVRGDATVGHVIKEYEVQK